jgi:hypothetical protein
VLPLLRDARDDAHLQRMVAHYRRTRGGDAHRYLVRQRPGRRVVIS